MSFLVQSEALMCMECSGPNKICISNFDELDQEFEGGHLTKCPDSPDAVCTKFPYEILKNYQIRALD